ncbi:MAG: CBS domain-containing protein [Betaproteobacteria bacterium]|nr:CBS domain-containing protein [Betaproteobacteria bacterium]
MKHVSDLFISTSTKLRDVLVRSNETRRGIVLVVDEARRLLGVVTDGDIRRAFLAGTDLDTTADELLEAKGARPRPITAPVGASHEQLMALLQETGVSHVPLVNAEDQVEKLVCLEDLLQEDELALHAVVMAGGRGTRLHPLTEDMPKPMLPVGDRPLMERIIRQLSETGIRQSA